MQITTVTVLLKDECTYHWRSESRQLGILQPDVAIGHQIRMAQLRKQPNLDKNSFQPSMVIPDRNSLAGEETKRTAVKLMLNKQHHTFSAFAKDTLFDEEVLEVIWGE
jgi:hypothetical protein